MTKKTIRILSLIMVMVSLFCMLSMGVQAASTTSSIQWSGTQKGGTSTNVYVKTGSTAASRKVSVTGRAGEMRDENSGYANVYGSYELKIYKWNGSKWVLEQNYDLYNKASATITLNSKNAYYKINIYAWKAQTIYTSYRNNNVKCADSIRFKVCFPLGAGSNARWSKLPMLTLKPGKSCTMYSGSPV